jgi:hypothetical protein
MRAALVLLTLLILGAMTDSASADVQLQRLPYNAVEVSDAAAITTMRVTARPGGLQYTAALDPTKTYRLRIRGRTTDNGVVMRIRTDDQVRFRRAPNGLYGARVAGAAELEILLFRHYETDDERYRIMEVSVEECAGQCKTDADLRNEILSDRRGLARALASDDRLAAATEIMRWVAVRVPVAGGTPPLITQTDGLSAAELWYDQLATHEVGVFCAGASALLVKLLHLFGIASFELDFGDPAVYTHATVVVDSGRPGAPEWHLLDPTFNVVLLAAASNAPLPLPEALEAWRAGRTDLIRVSEQSLIGRPIVYDPDADGIPEPLSCDADVTSGWSGCGLGHLAHDFDARFEAAGHGRGYAAILSLLARGSLFSTAYFGTPQEFVEMHARLRASLTQHDATTHVADLPLPPRNSAPPQIAGSAQLGRTVALGTGDWQLSPGDWDTGATVTPEPTAAVQWLSCVDACAIIAGAHGVSYTPSAREIGARLAARVTVTNRWGSTAAETTMSPRVVTVPSSVRRTPKPGASPARADVHTPRRAWIVGVRRVGSQLRCVTSGSPVAASVTWWRDDRRILRATGSRYRSRILDRGRFVDCRARLGDVVLRSHAVRVGAAKRPPRHASTWLPKRATQTRAGSTG